MAFINARKNVIDALRGYFIIWIGLYNTFAVFNAIHPNLVLSSILLFINDKGWFCLSAIFGYGFGVLIKRGNLKNGSFQKRMLLLFGIGIFNNLFYYGDILKEYAIIGLILFFTKRFSSKHPFIFVGFLFILTISALYFIPFDMQNAGNITSYFSNNNPFFANLEYCFNLNLHSLYFGISYHLEMLLMASVGYMIAFYHLESLINIYRKVLFRGAFWGMFCCLSFIFFVVEKSNPLLKITFFLYILSLSVCFVLGFYALTKKFNTLKTVLAGFGRRSLTIYLWQNILICTIWFWNSVQVILLLVSRFMTKNGIGLMEYYWRVWSLK
jgi:uncharacterized protein